MPRVLTTWYRRALQVFLTNPECLQVVGEGAARTPGKRSLAMEAFATALRSIPATICDNAGDADTRQPALRNSHSMMWLMALVDIAPLLPSAGPRAPHVHEDILRLLNYGLEGARLSL